MTPLRSLAHTIATRCYEIAQDEDVPVEHAHDPLKLLEDELERWAGKIRDGALEDAADIIETDLHCSKYLSFLGGVEIRWDSENMKYFVRRIRALKGGR